MEASPSFLNDLELGVSECFSENNSSSSTGGSFETKSQSPSTLSLSSDYSSSVSSKEDTCVDNVKHHEPKHAVVSSIKGFHVPPHPSTPQVLPKKWGVSPRVRNLRWLVFTTYRRLFTITFLVNVVVLISLAATRQLDFSNSASAASINLVVSLLARQEHVINLLFFLASSLSVSLPLWIRCRVAKVYCYGGIHSGCGIAAAAWYVAFTAYLTQAAVHDSGLWQATSISYAVLILLLLIIGSAYPTVRMKMHDNFEMTHRFAGWIVIAFYWAQIMLLTRKQSENHASTSFGKSLINTPSFWCVCILTACLLYPWIRLRHRTVYVEKLSDHAARLHFSQFRVDRCIGIRLSTKPLLESHAFATIPAARSGNGFSCVISNAGDWTRSIIREPSERTKIWMKGAPVYGVLRTALIFKRTIIVATGSGIGPCLSLLNDNDDIVGKCRVLWSTKAPLATYGENIINAVRQADPRATIIDTGKGGRPDMVELTYRLYKEASAEAVFLISNPVVTRKVIYGMEARGVPAFAPIFDS